jgi:hypothetical protein
MPVDQQPPDVQAVDLHPTDVAQQAVIDQEAKDYSFLVAVLETFKESALRFYISANSANRHDHATKIIDAITAIGNQAPGTILGPDSVIRISAPRPQDEPNNYGCPPETVCIGGMCIIPNALNPSRPGFPVVPITWPNP